MIGFLIYLLFVTFLVILLFSNLVFLFEDRYKFDELNNPQIVADRLRQIWFYPAIVIHAILEIKIRKE